MYEVDRFDDIEVKLMKIKPRRDIITKDTELKIKFLENFCPSVSYLKYDLTDFDVISLQS